MGDLGFSMKIEQGKTKKMQQREEGEETETRKTRRRKSETQI